MIVRNSLRVFFRLLYHPLSFAYDLVAWTVSFGRWQDWVMAVLPFVEGTRVLELGHGPGHLQRGLLAGGRVAVGLDESAQMGRIAAPRLGHTKKLARGLAQALPFAKTSFDTIVSTFPTEFIFDPLTLSEARRCLSDGGRLIVLPVARPGSALLRWIYRLTGEGPSQFDEAVLARLQHPFEQAGFESTLELVEVKSSQLLIVIARKRQKC